jgi:hypothetical protein
VGGADDLAARAHRACVGDAAELAGDHRRELLADGNRRFKREELGRLLVRERLGLDASGELGLGLFDDCRAKDVREGLADLLLAVLNAANPRLLEHAVGEDISRIGAAGSMRIFRLRDDIAHRLDRSIDVRVVRQQHAVRLDTPLSDAATGQ